MKLETLVRGCLGGGTIRTNCCDVAEAPQVREDGRVDGRVGGRRTGDPLAGLVARHDRRRGPEIHPLL